MAKNNLKNLYVINFERLDMVRFYIDVINRTRKLPASFLKTVDEILLNSALDGNINIDYLHEYLKAAVDSLVFGSVYRDTEHELICRFCKKKLQLLKKHVINAHKITFEDYKKFFGLPEDYPTHSKTFYENLKTHLKKISIFNK